MIEIAVVVRQARLPGESRTYDAAAVFVVGGGALQQTRAQPALGHRLGQPQANLAQRFQRTVEGGQRQGRGQSAVRGLRMRSPARTPFVLGVIER